MWRGRELGAWQVVGKQNKTGGALNHGRTPLPQRGRKAVEALERFLGDNRLLKVLRLSVPLFSLEFWQQVR